MLSVSVFNIRTDKTPNIIQSLFIKKKVDFLLPFRKSFLYKFADSSCILRLYHYLTYLVENT